MNDPELKKKYKSKMWRNTRNIMLIKNGFKCQKCGMMDASGSSLEVHHKNNATSDMDMMRFCDQKNLVLLCITCHNLEHKRIGIALEKETAEINENGIIDFSVRNIYKNLPKPRKFGNRVGKGGI